MIEGLKGSFNHLRAERRIRARAVGQKLARALTLRSLILGRAIRRVHAVLLS